MVEMPRMKELPLRLAMTVMAGSLFYSAPAAPESRGPGSSASVRIIDGPRVERVDPGFAIVRWTTNTPGGSPVRVGVVNYGTDRLNLNQTASSPIRLNPDHPRTVFRVRMEALKAKTTYYYAVDSTDFNGKSDGAKSKIKRFTTP